MHAGNSGGPLVDSSGRLVGSTFHQSDTVYATVDQRAPSDSCDVCPACMHACMWPLQFIIDGHVCACVVVPAVGVHPQCMCTCMSKFEV